jgi:ubiquitin-activating enzyme E1
MISCGVSILYSAFMTSKKKLEERLPMKMSELACSIAKMQLAPKQKYLIFEVCATDADDEDIETPYVRFRFRN